MKVGDVFITKDSLGNVIEIFKDDLTGYTDKYYEVLTSKNTVWDTTDLMGMGEVKLGILIGDQDAPKRIAMIRQTGMKIMDKDRFPGHVPFVGILFINGNEINERLRLIENPEHTQWQPERSKNPFQEITLLKEMNSYIKKKIEELASSSSNESIDAVGVGNYIPDEIAMTEDIAKEEVISDKILDVEVKKINKKTITGRLPATNEENNDNDKYGHMERGGLQEGWFHNDGNAIKSTGKPGEEAHMEEDSDKVSSNRITVRLEKFVSICVDKEKGKYALMITPDMDGDDGVIELFLSGETQNYEAPIIKASLIGGSVNLHKNMMKNVQFIKGQPLRISVELDYQDYCSMEVKLYATEK